MTVEVVLKNCPMISPCLSVAEALAINSSQSWKQHRLLKKSLLKKLKKRPTANKTTQDYILCLESLISGDDDNEQQHCSSDWVNSINCGSLACVNNMTFELFFTMECVLRTQLDYSPGEGSCQKNH